MYEYVTKNEVKIAKSEIEEVIHKVQKFLKGKISFQYHLVGSASSQRNLVTRIKGGNQGFDLDYNIIILSPNDSILVTNSNFTPFTFN